jgi:hypothetical protein
MGTIAVAAPKQAKVIVFDTGELDCVVQTIAAVGTCGTLYVVHDFLRPISARPHETSPAQEKTRGTHSGSSWAKGAVPQSRTRQKPIRQLAVLPLAGTSRAARG